MTAPAKVKFSVGDAIVYPGYGVGEVLELQEREFSGTTQSFLVLSFKEAENISKVMVPVSNLAGVGLRAPSTKKEVKAVLTFLESGQPEIVGSWKDRFTAHGEMLKQGDLLSVTQVLKALYILNRKKPLSFREKKMYQKALVLVASESALVLGRPRDQVEAEILKLLEACG